MTQAVTEPYHAITREKHVAILKLGFIPFKWKIRRFAMYGKQVPIHVCPNCGKPKFEGDSWGYVYKSDEQSPVPNVGYISCLQCGCRILESGYLNKPHRAYYEPVIQLTFWRNL